MQLYASLISGRSQLSRVYEKGVLKKRGFWRFSLGSAWVGQVTARPHREACQSRNHSCSPRFGAKHLTLTQVEKNTLSHKSIKIDFTKKKEEKLAASGSPSGCLFSTLRTLQLTKDSAKNMYLNRNEWSSWKWSELKFLLLRERSWCPMPPKSDSQR